MRPYSLFPKLITSATASPSSIRLQDEGTKQWIVHHNTKWDVSPFGRVISFDGVDSHLDFGKNPMLYPTSFTMWADVIVGDKPGEQHIYGHYGRDSQDYWCNAQFYWNPDLNKITFRVGTRNGYEVAKTGVAPNKRYQLIGRCHSDIIQFWVNQEYIGQYRMRGIMRIAPQFALRAGQREYVRWSSKAPFLGKLISCGMSLDTSYFFIENLFRKVYDFKLRPPMYLPDLVSTLDTWQQAEVAGVRSMFEYGALAYYIPQKDNMLRCKVFLDEGWQDEYNGIQSQIPEVITQVLIDKKDIPIPKLNDKIKINNKMYIITTIAAMDELITAVYVKSLN